MNNDMIDFPCSGTFLNAYHEQGLTTRYDGRRLAKTARQLTDDIIRLRKERQELRLTDEEWWMQKTQDQALQRLLDQKERTIQALRQELDSLRQRPPTKQTTHQGIKA